MRVSFVLLLLAASLHAKAAWREERYLDEVYDELVKEDSNGFQVVAEQSTVTAVAGGTAELKFRVYSAGTLGVDKVHFGHVGVGWNSAFASGRRTKFATTGSSRLIPYTGGGSMHAFYTAGTAGNPDVYTIRIDNLTPGDNGNFQLRVRWDLNDEDTSSYKRASIKLVVQ